MIAALDTYIEGALQIGLALLATAGCLILAVAIGGILYALYKGATDETWR